VTAVQSGRELCGSKDELTLATDVVVVGSGASGAVVAAELAEAGLQVLILEEGPHIPPAELGRLRPSQTVRRAWREAGMSFAFPVGDSPAINVMAGRCVGGSSVMTGGVCFRTPPEILHEWAHDHSLSGLAPERMVPYFDEVERRSHVELVPDAMRSRSTVLFAQGAQRLGYALKPNHRNTKDCDGCSRCNFGCPHQAKWSVDLTYLPRALRAGAHLMSDCLVERVLTHGEQAIGVSGRLLDADDRRRRRFTVRARRVILACGALHTPRLLLDSGLGEGLPSIGHNLTLHPSFRVMARFDEPVHGWRGALQSAHSEAFSQERITLMSVFVPAGVLAATLPGIGPAHVQRAKDVPHLAVFGGMVHDDAGGRVHPRASLLTLGGLLARREPVLTYELSRRDRHAVSRLLRVLGETFFAAGAREVILPILGGVPGSRGGGITADQLRNLELDRIPGRLLECASQHPLGSCRMGTARAHSVVDQCGQVWGLRELFVVDGSILPTSLGVNPQISIMAMATRIAWQLRERKLPEV
jgi:choline dehydrogenase-like flavoprotein